MNQFAITYFSWTGKELHCHRQVYPQEYPWNVIASAPVRAGKGSLKGNSSAVVLISLLKSPARTPGERISELSPFWCPWMWGSFIFSNTLSRIRWLWPSTFCLLLMKVNRSVEKVQNVNLWPCEIHGRREQRNKTTLWYRLCPSCRVGIQKWKAFFFFPQDWGLVSQEFCLSLFSLQLVKSLGSC